MGELNFLPLGLMPDKRRRSASGLDNMEHNGIPWHE